MTLEELKELPYVCRCFGGPSCPAQAFGTDPECEAMQGCPNCLRQAVHKNGEVTEYRLPRH